MSSLRHNIIRFYESRLESTDNSGRKRDSPEQQAGPQVFTFDEMGEEEEDDEYVEGEEDEEEEEDSSLQSPLPPPPAPPAPPGQVLYLAPSAPQSTAAIHMFTIRSPFLPQDQPTTVQRTEDLTSWRQRRSLEA